MDTPRPALRGKYSIRNPLWNFLFRCLDALLSLLVRLRMLGGMRKAQDAPAAPKRILISDIAHLGDVIMATSALPVLKSAFPQARIGFLVGSWSLPLLKDHPLIDDIHVLDHWMHNRARVSKREKIRQYLRTRREALHQIRAARYDAAFDFYWNFPNTLPLLWQAKIPMRVGYESGGFGPLATHCLPFGEKRLSAAQRFLDLLKTLPLREGDLEKQASCLPPLGELEPGAATFRTEMEVLGLKGKDYLVFHAGVVDNFREWPSQHWRELAERLTAQGQTLLFTGSGAADRARIEEIVAGLDGCVNLCDRLSWSGFVAAIADARLLVCVDTVAGHVAGATRTPCAVITAGRWPYLWRPLGPETHVLMAPVPCAPCHRNNGCAGMECIQHVSVASVYEASQTLLSAG